MPETKKEGILFGLMMCGGMVLGMTLYNLTLNHLFSVLTALEIIVQLLIAFIVAFAVESFLVGPVARKLALSIPFDKSNKLLTILAISTCMVIGMVLVMSVYGLITSSLANGLGEAGMLQSYLAIVGKNFIFALPLQLLIIGPLARFVLNRFIKAQSITQPNNIA